mmetsp:Transcript_163/g.538  ORF Transcript_163/g.538 Transcript_163/m.538 type:complete len:103 (+) Transcript_163:1319-1627(+)
MTTRIRMAATSVDTGLPARRSRVRMIGVDPIDLTEINSPEEMVIETRIEKTDGDAADVHLTRTGNMKTGGIKSRSGRKAVGLLLRTGDQPGHQLQASAGGRL